MFVHNYNINTLKLPAGSRIYQLLSCIESSVLEFLGAKMKNLEKMEKN